MKKPALRLALLVAAVCSVTVSCLHEKTETASGVMGKDEALDKNIVFENNEAAIFIPGTAISEADKQKMNAVLAQYRTSLYRVERYENGLQVGSDAKGTLPDGCIGGQDNESTAAQVRTNAKQHYLKGSALQVGFHVGTMQHVTPSPGPGARIGTAHHQREPSKKGSLIGTRYRTSGPGAETTCTPSDEDFADAKALVAKLKPILKKYSQ
jgi:hypothetical protein